VQPVLRISSSVLSMVAVSQLASSVMVITTVAITQMKATAVSDISHSIRLLFLRRTGILGLTPGNYLAPIHVEGCSPPPPPKKSFQDTTPRPSTDPQIVVTTQYLTFTSITKCTYGAMF